MNERAGQVAQRFWTLKQPEPPASPANRAHLVERMD